MVDVPVMPLDPEDLDQIDRAILDFFTEGCDSDSPWGRATPSVVYQTLDERGKLDELDNPSDSTVHNRINQLALAGHLNNMYKSGCYEFVDDPREE